MVKDNWSVSEKCLLLDFVFDLDYLRQFLVKFNLKGQFWNPQDEEIPWFWWLTKIWRSYWTKQNINSKQVLKSN